MTPFVEFIVKRRKLDRCMPLCMRQKRRHPKVSKGNVVEKLEDYTQSRRIESVSTDTRQTEKVCPNERTTCFYSISAQQFEERPRIDKIYDL